MSHWRERNAGADFTQFRRAFENFDRDAFFLEAPSGHEAAEPAPAMMTGSLIGRRRSRGCRG